MTYGGAEYTDEDWQHILTIRDYLQDLLPKIEGLSNALNELVPTIDRRKRGRKTNEDKIKENLCDMLSELPHGLYGNLTYRIEQTISKLEDALDARSEMLEAAAQEEEDVARAEYERLKERFEPEEED